MWKMKRMQLFGGNMNSWMDADSAVEQMGGKGRGSGMGRFAHPGLVLLL